MSILKVARMGHPVLSRRADPIKDPTAPEIRNLVNDMLETLADIGGIGLAAPPVHVPLRGVIFVGPAARAARGSAGGDASAGGPPPHATLLSGYQNIDRLTETVGDRSAQLAAIEQARGHYDHRKLLAGVSLVTSLLVGITAALWWAVLR